MYDIITIGSITRDIIAKDPSFLALPDSANPGSVFECIPMGSKIDLHEVVMTIGGGGANAAVTFARQGLNTACIGVVGADSSGQDIVTALQKEHIDTRFVYLDSDKVTALSVIMVHSSGERSILTYKGPRKGVLLEALSLDDCRAPWLYIDSLGGSVDILKKACQYVAKGDVAIAYNPGGDEIKMGSDKLGPLLKDVAVLIMNREEACEFLHISLDMTDRPLHTLHDMTKQIVVITDGPAGVSAIDAQGTIYHAQTPPDAPREDATGAGDAFGSGFVAEYMRSHDIDKSIQYGTANASSVVGSLGAQEGILRKGAYGLWPPIHVTKA